MDLSLSLDAKEVLFHLNYMGYRNVTKEQLKSFMIDLKQLIRYESNPVGSTEVRVQAGPTSINIQRLFEAHTVNSRTKQREKPKPQQSQQQAQPAPQRVHHQRPPLMREVTSVSDKNEIPKRTSRVCSAGRRESTNKPDPVDNTKTQNPPKTSRKPSLKTSESADKENVPAAPPQPKSKMWIRPRSGSQTARKLVKKTDPVALYQSYQKDWEKFKTNICESSHSDLRWTIREKMLGNR